MRGTYDHHRLVSDISAESCFSEREWYRRFSQETKSDWYRKRNRRTCRTTCMHWLVCFDRTWTRYTTACYTRYIQGRIPSILLLTRNLFFHQICRVLSTHLHFSDVTRNPEFSSLMCTISCFITFYKNQSKNRSRVKMKNMTRDSGNWF